MVRADPFDTILTGDPPSTRLAQVGLGLTVYLHDTLPWARGGAASLLGSFLELAPPDRLWWWTTSTLEDWHRVSASGIGQLQQSLCNEMLPVPRHQFVFQLADETSAPELGFLYREVDTARRKRTGVLEITFPPESDPGALLQIAFEIGHRWPFWCAVGGHQMRCHPLERSTAYWWGYRFARRFRGLDLQDSEQMAWNVDGGLPGSSWLTLVGTPMAEKLGVDLDALRTRDFTHGASATPVGGGILLRAGDQPSIGDVNRFEHLDAYTEVALALAPWFLKEPPRYYGGFWDDESATNRWLRRFVEPEEWE